LRERSAAATRPALRFFSYHLAARGPNTKHEAMAKRKPRKPATRLPDDPETLKNLVAQYEEIFGEVSHFVDLIATQEEEIAENLKAKIAAKERYDAACDEVNAAKDARDGTKHALFMYLKPGPTEIMPLFDRMEPADTKKHGKNSDEWRKEPIAALRLSLVANNLLAAADVLFVGQLQDRVQDKPDSWWEEIEGLLEPMAAALADKLNDFITEHTGK
jgi:hypothetical protein